MTTEQKDTGESWSDTGQRSDIKPIDEALAQQREDILVTYSKEINVGPEEGEYTHLFHRVEVRSFEDLQALTLIPEKLDEKRTRDALRSDDESVLDMAQNSLNIRIRSCGCHESSSKEDAQMRLNSASDLRTIYDTIRTRHNPQLAELLSEIYRREVAWDSLVAAHVHKWIQRLHVVQVIPLWILLSKDITILNNATLHLSASTNLLWANDIRIHLGGKLRSNSSYTKIMCVSIQGNIP